MIENTLWHPVAASADLAGEPLAVVLLEQAVVLWRDAAGVAHAWADQCPHRGAKLSLGRVCGDRLECPYHGWQFAASGQCVQVPAVPAFTPPATHTARTFAACERYGLVWVQLQTAEMSEPAVVDFAAEDDSRLRKLLCGPFDVATSAPRLVENFLDMAHFAFVHEGWLGARSASAIDGYQVESRPVGVWVTQCKVWQPQPSLHGGAAAQVEYTYAVEAPYAAVLTKVPESSAAAAPDFREAIGLFICPVGPEQSRVWFRLATLDTASDDEALRSFQRTIFSQDQPVLESQTPRRLPLDPRAELHTVADKASAAYRRYLKHLGITFGVC
ncbi:MAG: aromatic ring-hydroxylating dioxygenase subunit alpha [Rhodoferax sp.]|uniref:aromatic ring-hydroxylating dioxygenase subunit alpha n=1 Tax=Rhodoferax sp. TaxID=50421 RepID=UPI0032660E06